MGDDECRTLAERLDRAAQKSGLTNEEIGERLGVTGGNVAHWRKGRHRPDVETVQRFAAVVGASEYYLLTGKKDHARYAAAFQEAMRQWREAVVGGEDAAAAWERILGRSDLFSVEDRARLSGQSEGLAEFLVSVDGVEWVELSERQHRVIRELIELLALRRND